MNEKAVICEKCFKQISATTPRLISQWLNYCDRHYFTGNFPVHFLDENMLQLLEAAGLIVSTENDLCFMVKVLGQKLDENGIYYCPRGCDG